MSSLWTTWNHTSISSMAQGVYHPFRYPRQIRRSEFQGISWLVVRQDRQYPTPTLNHCDSNPANIITRDDKVVGFIDLEFSGWYPHYWEYMPAWSGHQVRTDGQKLLPGILDVFPKGIEMERVCFKSWGEWGLQAKRCQANQTSSN